MRVLFYGTPEFALPTLDALLDPASGRGRRDPARQPRRPRTEAHGASREAPRRSGRHPGDAARPAARSGVAGAAGRFNAEVAVVVAFGQILPKAVLDVPDTRLDQRPRLAPAALSRRRADRVGHHPRRNGDGHHDLPDGSGHGHGGHAPPGIDAHRRRGDGGRAWRADGRTRRRASCSARSTSSTRSRRRPRTMRAATLAPRIKKEDGWLRLAEPARALVNRVRG